jgi:hypothetical protein
MMDDSDEGKTPPPDALYYTLRLLQRQLVILEPSLQLFIQPKLMSLSLFLSLFLFSWTHYWSRSVVNVFRKAYFKH